MLEEYDGDVAPVLGVDVNVVAIVVSGLVDDVEVETVVGIGMVALDDGTVIVVFKALVELKSLVTVEDG